MGLADGQVTIKAGFDVDTSGLSKIDKEVEKSTRKSRITISEYAKQNNMTIEQVKQEIYRLVDEYKKAGQTIQNAYKKTYRDLGVLPIPKEKLKELTSETENLGEEAEKTAKKTKSYGEENKNAAKKTEKLGDSAEKAKKVTKNLGSALKKTGELAGKAASGGLKASLKVFQGLASFSVSAFRATATGVAAGFTTIATAATGLIGMGTAFNAEIEQYRTSFEVMTGSYEKADEIIERLKKIGAETPFELSDVAEATQLLMNYGFTADDAVESMMMLGDISQGNKDKLTSIARAFGQMSSKGKVLREEINQMVEAGFSPLLAISEATGESMESLDLRLEAGTITVDEIRDAIVSATSEGGKYFQSMIKQSKTFSGQLSTLKDNLKSFTGVMAEAATGSKANEFFPLLNESLTTLEDALTTGGFKQMAKAFGKELSKFIQMGLSYIPNLMDLGTDIMLSIVYGFLSGEKKLEKSVQTIFKKLPSFISRNLDTGLKVGKEFIRLIAEGINQNTSYISNNVKNIIASFVGFFEENAPLVKEAATNLINALAEGITADSDKITSSIFNVLTMIPQFISENIGTISTVIVSFIQNISNGINENKQLLQDAAATIVQELTGGLADSADIVLSIVTEIINVISDAIVRNETVLSDAVSKIIGSLITFITNNINPIVNAALTIVRALIGGLSDTENTKLIASTVVDIISLIGDVISENLGDILGAALTIIKGIADGLKSADASEKLAESISIILNSIIDAVKDNTDIFLEAASSIVSFIMDDLLTPETINTIIDGMSDLMEKINEELLSDENIDKMINTGEEIVVHIFDGIKRALLNIDLGKVFDIAPDIISFLQDPGGYIQNSTIKKIRNYEEDPFWDKMDEETNGLYSILFKGSSLESINAALNSVKNAADSLYSGITSSVTNTSNVDNSQTATYNITNNNVFNTKNSDDATEMAVKLQKGADSIRRGKGY